MRFLSGLKTNGAFRRISEPTAGAGRLWGATLMAVVAVGAGGPAAVAQSVKAPAAETSYQPAKASIYRDGILVSPGAETTYGAAAPAPARPVRVALFADPGSTDAKSREAIWAVLSQAEGIDAIKVTTTTVRSAGFLDKYDVFILPGGTGGGEAAAVGVEAGRDIARRLRAGKGLVAVCAGGYYVAEGWNAATSALDVVNAQNHDSENWARGEQYIAVKVVGQDDAKSSRTMWYENGPLFKPASLEGMTDYVPLVRYETDLAAKGAPKGQMKGRDAVIAAEYGRGRVVAFGPHPELSPGLEHWLVNAVKWAAGQGEGKISAETVLEGR